MNWYHITIPPHVAAYMTHLPPSVKRDAKQALRVLVDDPRTGEPLKRELEGLWKYRIRSFRTVYQITAEQRVVRVIAVGHRSTVYELVRSIRGSGS